MSEERKGIADLMERNRYRSKHLQDVLIDNNIPGKWEGRNGLQNVYNLMNGKIVPRDAYVFIFLSEFLKEPLKEILMRFTTNVEEKEEYKGQTINW